MTESADDSNMLAASTESYLCRFVVYVNIYNVRVFFTCEREMRKVNKISNENYALHSQPDAFSRSVRQSTFSVLEGSLK